MLALISIFWLSILAATVLGSGLALLGAQLAARDRAMQTMCVGQGAMLGVLVGVGLCQFFHLPAAGEASVPFVLALLSAAVTYWVSERAASRKAASSNTHFAALFAALLAGGNLVSAVFPALENHMAQKYFGDLATMSEGAAATALAVGAVLLGVLGFFSRVVTRDSFAVAILGSRRTQTQIVFAIGTLVTLCFSVQVVGFLFTASSLFLPTSILSFGRKSGLRSHLASCANTAAFACCGGFAVSLCLTRLPTVPTIAFVMCLSALFLNLMSANVAAKYPSNRRSH